MGTWMVCAQLVLNFAHVPADILKPPARPGFTRFCPKCHDPHKYAQRGKKPGGEELGRVASMQGKGPLGQGTATQQGEGSCGAGGGGYTRSTSTKLLSCMHVPGGTSS